jgi:hypothetical protein
MTKKEYENLTKERLSMFLPKDIIINLLTEYPITTGLAKNHNDFYGWVTKGDCLILYRSNGIWIEISSKNKNIYTRETKYIKNYCEKANDKKLYYIFEKIKSVYNNTKKNFDNNYNNFIAQKKENESFGEFQTRLALEDLKLVYIQEFEINDLKGKAVWKETPRYDFVVLDNNNQILFAIEYDGEQHFEENFKQQSRDAIKNMYANTSYPLGILRIPYLIKDKEEIKTILQNFLNQEIK